jgi:large subunit ribosomal protein L32
LTVGAFFITLAVSTRAELLARTKRDKGFFMAVPKRKHSNARSGSRCARDHKNPKQLYYCPQCSTALPSHVVCPNCGYYMGRTVVQMEE